MTNSFFSTHWVARPRWLRLAGHFRLLARRETRRYSYVADEPVSREPVSKGIFPANREENREIEKINAAEAKLAGYFVPETKG